MFNFLKRKELGEIARLENEVEELRGFNGLQVMVGAMKFVPEDGAAELVLHLRTLADIPVATPFHKLTEYDRDRMTFIAAKVVNAAKR